MSNADSESLEHLPLDVLRQLHQVCEAFERAWTSGAAPSLDEFLDQVHEDGRAGAFEELLSLEWEYGGRPSNREALSQYLERYPEQADVVSRLWNESLAESLAAAPLAMVGDYRIIREIGRGGMGVVYLAEQVSLGRNVAIKILSRGMVVDPIRRERFQREARSAASLQHANIVPVYGVGCDQDIDYYVMLYIDGESLDETINRLAADQHQGADAGKSATRLPLHDSNLSPGEEGAAASEGDISVETNINNSSGSGERVYFRSVARTMMQAAAALDYAHGEGILHRDVKPSNLVLDKTGKIWITDFGLAKVLADTDQLTRTGDVAGTLQYMAPETFDGRADVRSDIYGLGLTLYELLTLQRPYRKLTRGQLIEQVLHGGDPLVPRRINSRIPRDLETICLKCIQKEPRKRYDTSGDLMDDLRRFLDGEPIRARRVPFWTKATLWARRKPAIASVSLLALLMTLGALAGLTWGLIASTRLTREAIHRAAAEIARSESERARAEDERVARKREEELRRDIEVRLTYSRVSLAQRSWQAGELATAKRLLDLCVPGPGEVDYRGWEWDYVNRLCNEELAVFKYKFWVNALAFSPDGKWLACGAGSPGSGVGDQWIDSELSVQDVSSGEVIATLIAADEPVPAIQRLEIDVAGRWLLAGDAAGMWHVWDTSTWRRHNSVSGLDAACLADGRTLAVIGKDGELLHYDLIEGGTATQVRAPLAKFDDRLTGAFSDGNRFVAVRAFDFAETYIVDPGTGADVNVVNTTATPAPLAVGPLGLKLVTAEHLWDVASGRDLGLMAHTPGTPIFIPTFSPNGAWVAWTRYPRNELVLARTNAELTTQRAWDHLGAINKVAFSADSKVVATASADKTVRLWDVGSGQAVRTLRGHRLGVRTVVFSPDGTTLATASQDRTVRLWDRNSNPLATTITLDDKSGENLSNFTFAADGKELVAAHHTGQFAFDIGSGRQVFRQPSDMRLTHQRPRSEVAFSPAGRVLVAASEAEPDLLKVWDLTRASNGELPASKDRNLIRTLRGHSAEVRCVAASDQANWIASIAFDVDDPDVAEEAAELFIWNEQGTPLWAKQTTPASCVALSPDGTLVAAAGMDWKIRVWDTRDGRERFTTASLQARTRCLVFSNDARRLAAATVDGVQVRDVATGDLQTSLDTSSAEITSVAFSPDGRRLATAALDEAVVHLWDAATGESVFALRRMAIARPAEYAFMARIAFSPDGVRIAANNWNGSIDVWTAEPSAASPPNSLERPAGDPKHRVP